MAGAISIGVWPSAAFFFFSFFYVFCEEAGRWGFVREARKPIRSGAIFAIAIVLFEFLLSLNAGLSFSELIIVRFPASFVHIISGALSMLYAQKKIPIVVFSLVVGIHGLMNVTSEYWAEPLIAFFSR